MATSYPGFQSYVSSAPSPTSPYGRFIAGLAADDLDLDDAQHLMALAMAAVDSCQWLGWRVGYLNVVDGSTGNNTLTAGITNYNAWDFKGTFVVDGATARFSTSGGVFMFSDMTVGQGASILVGTNAHGIGQIIIDGAGSGSGSNLLARNGSNIIADGAGLLKAQNGGTVFVDTASAMHLANFPNISTNPGHDGALSSGNITKMVVVFASDGAGGFSTIASGYNVSGNITLQGTTGARITFVRAMRSSNYFIGGSITALTAAMPPVAQAFMIGVSNATTTSVDISAFIDAVTPVNLASVTAIFTFRIEIVDPSITP